MSSSIQVPLSHYMNDIRKNEFINLSHEPIRNQMKKILDNTYHISYSKFKEELINRFNKILKDVNNHIIYVYIDNYCDDYLEKSNYWIYQLLNNYLLNTDYKISINIIHNLSSKQLKDDDTILLIDDCIYSGEQMKHIINDMSNEHNYKFNFYILVPYASNHGIEKIRNTINNSHLSKFCKFEICDYIEVKTVNDILTVDEIKDIEYIYVNNISLNNLSLIYFDHKLADHYSVPTLIYSGLVPNEYNKNLLYKIKDLKKQINNYLSKNIKDSMIEINKLIELLEYREFINFTYGFRNFNQLYPTCLVPPYKKDYITYLENIELF